MSGIGNSTSTNTSHIDTIRRAENNTNANGATDAQRTPATTTTAPAPQQVQQPQPVVDTFQSSNDNKNWFAGRPQNREPAMPGEAGSMDATSTSSLYGDEMQTITGDMPMQGPTQNPLVDQTIDKTTTALAGQIVNKPVDVVQGKIEETTAAINNLPADKRAAAAGAGAQVLSDTAAKLPQAYINNQKDAVWDVKEGDSLTSIASHYVDPKTNQPLKPEALAAENPELTGDASSTRPRTKEGNMIYPGERVDIPEGFIPVTENALLQQQQAALNGAAAKLAAMSRPH